MLVGCSTVQTVFYWIGYVYTVTFVVVGFYIWKTRTRP